MLGAKAQGSILQKSQTCEQGCPQQNWDQNSCIHRDFDDENRNDQDRHRSQSHKHGVILHHRILSGEPLTDLIQQFSLVLTDFRGKLIQPYKIRSVKQIMEKECLVLRSIAREHPRSAHTDPAAFTHDRQKAL